jgi:hypothetical protein
MLSSAFRAQNVAFEELIIADEIHDLLRWNDWPAPTAPPPNSWIANWLAQTKGNKIAATRRNQITEVLPPIHPNAHLCRSPVI